MNIVIIGAGNLATHLSKALFEANYSIVQIFSKTEESARMLAQKLNCNYTTNIADIITTADVYIYAVKDSVLHLLIEDLAITSALHIHTAGSISINIFKHKYKNYGVLYPLQTFSKSKAVDFKSIPMFIEGSNEAVSSILESIAKKTSDKIYHINSEQRMKLHLAAVFTCNFTNYMYTIGEDIMTEAGLDFDVLKPLINETANKVQSLSPKKAQTGPAVRFDENVINKHLAMLEKNSKIKNLYLELSNLIFENTKKNS